MNQRRRWRRPGVLTAALALSALAGLAQEAIGQFVLQNATTVNGGIISVKNACFTLSSTIGEPVSGPTGAGSYVVTSGFLGQPVPAALRDSIFNDSFEECD